MKRAFSILLVLSFYLLPSSAQDFIGCRTGDGWAETPMLRKTFTLAADDIREGTVYMWVTSLGYHEVYINGKQVGDYVMQPAVSQLDKRALMVYYDITKYLHDGDNEIMLWIGQGWGRIYGTPAAVQAQVWWMSGLCEYNLLVATDSSWEASPSGYSYTGSWQPLQFGGERLDARVKPDWRPASIYDAEAIEVSRQDFSGNRIIDTVEVQTFMVEADGSTLLDFGRVITGWYQALFRLLPEGEEVSFEYLDNIDAKPPHTETDIYISRGSINSPEQFTNRFHMHSFRYVRVKGGGSALSYSRAIQIGAVSPTEGATFECSDQRLNAIHDMVKHTLSNLTFSGYMVDCPHLERMGYGGDGNSSTMTLQTLWDVRDTYRNWLTAWGDAMDTTGDLPYVAPAFRTGGGPYWSGFIIKAPWRTYLNYGDSSLIVQHYDAMCRWLRFVESHFVDDILQPWPDTERRNWFIGDWLAPEGVDIGGESVPHVSSCFIADCLADMVHMANMLNRPDDAALFSVWRQRIIASIHRHYYHPETHTYANGTPLDQAYALLQGIPPDNATAQVVRKQLLNDCHLRYRDHIAVGLMGLPIFTEWCISERQAGLMATILRQPDYPGYLYMINNGATTTWESWDCGRPGKEDRSRVHNCYNGIGVWFYQALAGIRPDPMHPGYKHFFIDPQPVGGIEWIKASKPTPYGIIRVEIDKGKLTVDIPKGTTATVFPNTSKERTLQSGEWVLGID